MAATPEPGTAPRAASWALTIVLRREPDGPEVAREPVSKGDLLDAVGELWLEGILRRGGTDVALDDLAIRVAPERAAAERAYDGYCLEAMDRDGNATRRSYSLASLEHVASRAAARLVADGILGVDDVFYYTLAAAPDDDPVQPADTGPRLRTRPLAPLAIEIAPLLERAATLGPAPAGPEPYRVFYTAAALAAAEHCSRRGAHPGPPVETGGVLVGFLCACPASGELFAVVVEVLEAEDADQRPYALAYTASTWARIRALIAARQRDAATRGVRMLGQCHGHNFVPGDGAAPCAVCATRARCTRTSVFVSLDDWNWNRAVFRRQPWQLCQIFGLNARGEREQGLFGLRDGRLQARRFHVLDDFDPKRC